MISSRLLNPSPSGSRSASPESLGSSPFASSSISVSPSPSLSTVGRYIAKDTSPTEDLLPPVSDTRYCIVISPAFASGTKVITPVAGLTVAVPEIGGVTI